jgi:hypothetical protein
MVQNLLEICGLEEAHNSSVLLEIPNDAGSIGGSGNCISVCVIDFDVINSASMFLQAGFHCLSLSSDLPDSHFSLHSSGDNPCAAAGGGEGGDTVVVCVIDGIIQFS